jgi:hypothetical protein
VAVKNVAFRQRILACSFIASAVAFAWLNTWHIYPCWDCMIPRGRPFHYMITSGFAMPGRYLWRGLLADCGVVVMFAACLYWLSILMFKRLKGKSN